MRDYVRDNMVAYTGPYPYIQGLVFRATDKVCDTPVTHFERAQGTSGYTLRSLVKLWTAILGLSVVPLRIAAGVGALLSLAGIVWAVAIVVNRLLGAVSTEGWASLMATLLVCSGLILLFLGLIGEYLGRLSLTATAAPQYEVRSALNVVGGVDQEKRVCSPGPAGQKPIGRPHARRQPARRRRSRDRNPFPSRPPTGPRSTPRASSSTSPNSVRTIATSTAPSKRPGLPWPRGLLDQDKPAPLGSGRPGPPAAWRRRSG